MVALRVSSSDVLSKMASSTAALGTTWPLLWFAIVPVMTPAPVLNGARTIGPKERLRAYSSTARCSVWLSLSPKAGIVARPCASRSLHAFWLVAEVLAKSVRSGVGALPLPSGP